MAELAAFYDGRLRHRAGSYQRRLDAAIRPELADRFGLAWVRPAGKTEIRCYYGAVSWGLAGFAAYLWSRGLELEALTGVLFLAGAVLTTRVVGTVVDRAADDPYTRLAIPTEAAFVLALALVRFTA